MTTGPEDSAWGGVPADVARALVRAADRGPTTVVSLLDADMTTRWVSRSTRWLAGLDPETRTGRSAYERIHPDDVEQLLHGLAQLRSPRALRTPGGVPVLEPLRYRWRAPDGSWLTLEALVINLLDDPEVAGLVVVQRFVHGPFGGADHVVDLLVADAPLPEVLAGCAALVAGFAAHAAVVALVDGEPVVGAPAGTAAEDLSADDGWWRATLADGRARIPSGFDGFPDQLADQARAAGCVSARVTPLTDASTGEVIGCLVLWMRLDMPPEIPVQGTGQAERLATLVIGEQRRQHALRREAATDPLTGVGNRSALRRRLEEAEAADVPVTVALVDLDEFKCINDAHGHAAGDAVLQAVGERLAATAGEDDLVVRFGGDEFAVVFGPATPAAEAARTAERMAEAIRAPIAAGDGVTLTVGASVGLATGPPGDVIPRADSALYEAKKA